MKLFFYITIFSVALGASCKASYVLPDETVPRALILQPDERSYDSDSDKYKADHRGAAKALRSLGIVEAFDSNISKDGSYGEVYLSPHCAVKITKPYDNSDAETERVYKLKQSLRVKPVSGFDIVLPRVIFKPKTRTGLDCLHIYVMPRINPVKSMSDILQGGIAEGHQEDLNMILSFGYRLGQMQQASLVQKANDGKYYCDAHLDLNANNIFPTSFPTIYEKGKFSLIDCSDLRRGSFENAVSISDDPIYFTMRNALFILHGPNAPMHWQRIDRLLDFVKHFYYGYASSFKNSAIPSLIKSKLGTNSAYEDALSESPFQILSGWNSSYFLTSYRFFALPVIRAVFETFEVSPTVLGNYPCTSKSPLPPSFQLNGFWNAEGAGTWTIGKQSTIRFRLSNAYVTRPKHLIVDTECGMLANRGFYTTAVLSLAGADRTMVTMDSHKYTRENPKKTFILQLPTSLSNDIELKIDVPWALAVNKAPISLANGDTRELGILIKSIMLK